MKKPACKYKYVVKNNILIIAHCGYILLQHVLGYGSKYESYIRVRKKHSLQS